MSLTPEQAEALRFLLVIAGDDVEELKAVIRKLIAYLTEYAE